MALSPHFATTCRAASRCPVQMPRNSITPGGATCLRPYNGECPPAETWRPGSLTTHGIRHILVHFTLYSRSYCHLCDDMAEALQALSGEYRFTLELVDIDTDETLVAQFDELVPVLFGRHDEAASVQLCHYFFDESRTRAFLTNT